jgi:hypothetical protein
MRPFIYIAFISLFIACSRNKQKDNSDKDVQIDISEVNYSSLKKTSTFRNKSTETSDQLILTMTSDSSYCYINDVIYQDDNTYLKVDFIQFFLFDKAIEEAKKRGAAEYDIEENGDTTYFVYNDYYIANDNPKLRIFKLTDSVDIKLLEELGDTSIDFKNKKKAMRRVEFSPFIIKTEGGIITQLHEIYTP